MAAAADGSRCRASSDEGSGSARSPAALQACQAQLRHRPGPISPPARCRGRGAPAAGPGGPAGSSARPSSGWCSDTTKPFFSRRPSRTRIRPGVSWSSTQWRLNQTAFILPESSATMASTTLRPRLLTRTRREQRTSTASDERTPGSRSARRERSGASVYEPGKRQRRSKTESTPASAASISNFGPIPSSVESGASNSRARGQRTGAPSSPSRPGGAPPPKGCGACGATGWPAATTNSAAHLRGLRARPRPVRGSGSPPAGSVLRLRLLR